jgi:hypothetical protein
MQAGQQSDDAGQCFPSTLVMRRFVVALRRLSPVRLRRWALWMKRFEDGVGKGRIGDHVVPMLDVSNRPAQA